jgi:hypothetical protein
MVQESHSHSPHILFLMWDRFELHMALRVIERRRWQRQKQLEQTGRQNNKYNILIIMIILIVVVVMVNILKC